MQKRVAILGGGPMGLAVAYQLLLDGFQPVLFEADDRIGGMTATFDFSGVEIERFYHFHCTSDLAFLQILGELGIADKMRWKETKMGYWHKGKLQSWGNPVALLKFDGLGWSAKFRYGLHIFLSTKRKNWRPLDNLYATEWVSRWVGTEAYQLFWRRLFEYKFYDYANSISAAWIWSRIRRLGRSRYSLMREKLGYLEGGSATLLKALMTAIDTLGGEVRLKMPVEKVVIEGSRVVGVQIRNQVELFDKVVSTIPLPFVSRIIPDLPLDVLEKFNSLKSVAVVCVIVKLNNRLTENFWLNVIDPDSELLGLIEYTNLRPLDKHVLYAPFYLPGEHPLFSEPDDFFQKKVLSCILQINPSLSEDDIVDIRTSRYRYAQPICEPGHLSRLPPPALPVTGLWVADTSHYYPEDRGISESIGFGRKLAKMVAAGDLI